MSNTHHDRRLFVLLLIPSWLSGIIAVIAGVGVAVGTIVLAHYRGSSVQVDFLRYRSGGTVSDFETVSSGLQANKLIANLPLLMFWGLVGLVVYLFAINIIEVVKNTAQLTEELGYAHVNRRRLVWDAAKRLLVRLLVIALWVPYILFFFHRLLPYCISNMTLASAKLPSFPGLMHTLLVVVIMVLAIHAHTVLLRLLFLRPRLFSKALYVD